MHQIRWRRNEAGHARETSCMTSIAMCTSGALKDLVMELEPTAKTSNE